MNELKVVARLTAQERGQAVPLTRERAFPISARPMVMVPIVMAGESPALFALGIGDGVSPCAVFVCHEPRNRDEQYEMLVKAAVPIQNFLTVWGSNLGMMPQIITSSNEAARMVLATIHRMTYAPNRPELNRAGRQLHWLYRASERVDFAALLSMPSALGELFATGQDEYADAHLGAQLEWNKPADGRIYDRVLEAERYPASTSTDPNLDNNELVPRVEALGRAERSGDTRLAARMRQEIEGVLRVEVLRRDALAREALHLCRTFPPSAIANHVQEVDRAEHDRNSAYVANPANLLASKLTGNAATSEFLSRELNAELAEQIKIRSVSAARAGAYLSGDIIGGEIVRRTSRKDGLKTIIEYQVRTEQQRLPVRRGDLVTLIETDDFKFVVDDTYATAAGDTIVALRMKAGMRKAGQPDEGEQVELAAPLGSRDSIARTMGIAGERLRSAPAPRPVTTRLTIQNDYLAAVKARRSTP